MQEPFIKFKCYEVPNSLENYQKAIDAVFAAGRAYGQSETKFEIEGKSKIPQINYDVVFEFSDKHKVDYSKLCSMVEKSVNGSRFNYAP